MTKHRAEGFLRMTEAVTWHTDTPLPALKAEPAQCVCRVFTILVQALNESVEFYEILVLRRKQFYRHNVITGINISVYYL